MQTHILRRCDVCKNYHVSYVVTDPESGGKVYLCTKCWQVRHAAQLATIPKNVTDHTAKPAEIKDAVEKILLTGRPGCGKTTLLRLALAQIPGAKSGFFTQELREAGSRVGFEVVTLEGQRAILAHVSVSGAPRVGKYGVDVSTFERVAIPAVEKGLTEAGLVVIDEIGPMEILSEHFRRLVLRVLESQVPLVGTIVQRSTPFTDAVKAHSGVTLIEVTLENRERLLNQIVELLTRP